VLSNTARLAIEGRPEVTRLELARLDGLACGCIVSVQRVQPTWVFFVRVEAKGPYCPFPGHRTDQVCRIGDPTVWPQAGENADPSVDDDGDGGTSTPA